jgi:tetratricopeptide (TPR) repeat protein
MTITKTAMERATGRGTRMATRPGIAIVITAMAFAAACFPRPAAGQAGRARVEEGNRLYRDGLFDEAHQKYLEAMAEAPDMPLIPFNDGNALYQNLDYQRAMEAYERAIETGDPTLAGAAWYNLGNALYRQQQLEPALEAYKQALRLNPSDADAKHNLEWVLEQMQQQEQQQQQQEGDSEEDQEEQDQQQDQEQDQQQQQPGEGNEQDQQDEQQGQQDQEQDQQDQQPQGEPEPRPGEMSQEEAERLLAAVDEDPGDVNRKPLNARGRRPKKPW